MSLSNDMRGRHGNNTMRLLPEGRRAVTDFICSKRATESHYRRSTTRKRYFDCHLAAIWAKLYRNQTLERVAVRVLRVTFYTEFVRM